MMAVNSPSVATLQPRSLSAFPPKPLVSVLVGNYNYARYIGPAIESVIGQTYPNWELIICDDGSTDESVAVIEQYVQRDNRIRLLRKTNGGHASALNAAFSECRGEVICLLDSDDWYVPAKLETLIGAFAASPAVGFSVHKVIRVNEHRARQGLWPLSDSIPEGWLGPDLLCTGGVLPYAPPTSGISLRRETAQDLFPLSTVRPLHMCPDQVIVRLAPLITSVKRLPEALAEYRLHAANTYSQRRITAESVTRELLLSRALWEEQYRFLSGFSSDIAEQLTVLENSSYIALMEYLKAKLGTDPNTARYHAEYLALCERQGTGNFVWFWRMSIYLPGFAFRQAVNTVLGQGAVKQLAAQIKRFLYLPVRRAFFGN